MEAGELSYITSTLDPYFECWESAVRRDLLTSRQYGAYTVVFDRSTLVRNDVRALHDSLARGIQSWHLQPERLPRKLLGLESDPGWRSVFGELGARADRGGDP